MKEQKGITLIALVITIIVLLILAGVTIAMLVGQNGILTNANNSASSNAYYGADEQMKLAYMTVRTQIMAERVANSKYEPASSEQKNGTGDNATPVNNTAGTNNNIGELAKLVKKDLGFSNPTINNSTAADKTDGNWTVEYGASDGIITITYTDSKIYGGTITKESGTVNTAGYVAPVPKTNGTVVGKITVSGNGGSAGTQSASYAFDV